MTGTASFQRRVGIILAALIILASVCLVQLNSEAGISPARPDIITIDLSGVPGGESMPAVRFLHDHHTENLKSDKGCGVCHLKKDKTFIFKFKRTEDGDPATDMAIYHDNCIGCHQKTIRSGDDAGPVAGDCRSCHNRKPAKAVSVAIARPSAPKIVPAVTCPCRKRNFPKRRVIAVMPQILPLVMFRQ